MSHKIIWKNDKMLALDLFNTKYERDLAEGAVDDLEARRIDTLNDRMQDLLARAKEPAYKKNPAALASLKKQFQQVKDERDSYYKVREAGIPGNIPVEKIPGKEDLLKGKGRSYYEDDQKKNSEAGPLDQKLQRLKVQARRQFPRAQTDDEALVLKLLDKETRDDRLNRQVDARQDAELRKNFALDREQEDEIEDLQTQVSVKEHGGGIGPKQRWQDLMPEQTNPNDDWYDDDEDQETELRSGDYVRDTMDGESGEVFRMQGDPYERRVRILDRDGKGWYIEPSRLTRVDPQDPDIQRYFGKHRVRDMDEGKADYNFDAEDLKRLERIRDLPTLKTQALALISRPSAKPMKPEKVEWFKNALDRMNSPIKVIKLMYDLLLSGEGHAVVGSRSSMNPNSYRQRFGEQGVEEGWSDAMLSRRTGQPRTPYTVYIKGKKWKDFENEDHAEAVANKLRAKFKADGRNPETITIAPTDMTEGLKSTLAGAALAGAMALGGAGAAQAQSAAGGSSMPNATTIIQQIQTGKIQNQNDLSAALGDNQSIRRFVFTQLQAKAGLPGHGADSVINALAKKSTAGTQQSGAQQPVKSAGQSGVIVQRPTDNFESQIKEDQDSSGVERAILNRIMVAHTDLLMKFGPDKVMQAAEEVAYNVGDVDEIGTSDVSAYVAQVKQILGATA
jgi:hypothetical protein